MPVFYAPTAHRFREARFTAGIDVPTCAKLLHVSERTIRNWESAQTRIPYTAYKLLRILKNGSFLGPEWRGYSIHRDTLHTPEGHTFKASELSWWSFLVRQAREYQRLTLQRVAAAVDSHGELALPSVLSMPRRPGAAAGKDPKCPPEKGQAISKDVVASYKVAGATTDAVRRMERAKSLISKGNPADSLKGSVPGDSPLSLTQQLRPAITNRKTSPGFTPLRPAAPSRSLRNRAREVQP